MMTLSPIDQQQYETSAVQITYCKLFPLISEDFLTRLDCKEMMKSTNLIVQVNAGQMVTTTGSPFAQSGSTTSPGSGKTNAPYKGSFETPATISLKEKKKALKEAGGQAVGSVLDTAIGG